IPCPHPDPSGPAPPFSLRSSDVSCALLRYRRHRLHKKAPDFQVGGAWGPDMASVTGPCALSLELPPQVSLLEAPCCVADIRSGAGGRQQAKFNQNVARGLLGAVLFREIGGRDGPVSRA